MRDPVGCENDDVCGYSHLGLHPCQACILQSKHKLDGRLCYHQMFSSDLSVPDFLFTIKCTSRKQFKNLVFLRRQSGRHKSRA